MPGAHPGSPLTRLVRADITWGAFPVRMVDLSSRQSFASRGSGGSNPLSFTAGQSPVPILEAGSFEALLPLPWVS